MRGGFSGRGRGGHHNNNNNGGGGGSGGNVFGMASGGNNNNGGMQRNNSNNSGVPTDTISVRVTDILQPVTESLMQRVFDSVGVTVRQIRIQPSGNPNETVAVAQFADAFAAERVMSNLNNRNIFNDGNKMTMSYVQWSGNTMANAVLPTPQMNAQGSMMLTQGVNLSNPAGLALAPMNQGMTMPVGAGQGAMTQQPPGFMPGVQPQQQSGAGMTPSQASFMPFQSPAQGMGGNGIVLPNPGVALPQQPYMMPQQMPFQSRGGRGGGLARGGGMGRGGRGGFGMDGGMFASAMPGMAPGFMPMPFMNQPMGFNPMGMGGMSGGVAVKDTTTPTVYLSLATVLETVPLQSIFLLLEAYGGVVTIRRNHKKREIATVKMASIDDAENALKYVQRVPVHGRWVSCKRFPNYTEMYPCTDDGDPLDAATMQFDFTASKHRSPGQRSKHSPTTTVKITGCGSYTEAELMTYLNGKSFFPERITKNEDGSFTVQVADVDTSIKLLIACQGNVCGEERSNVIFVEAAKESDVGTTAEDKGPESAAA